MDGIWILTSSIKAIDFAGGTVVHMTSGWSALILCLILGPRLGFKKEPMPPHSMVLCMIGTECCGLVGTASMPGSAVAADGIAANAFMATTLATAIAAFTWATIEKIFPGQGERARLLFRRGCWTGGDYPGMWLRKLDRGGYHRCPRWGHPLPGGLDPETGSKLR